MGCSDRICQSLGWGQGATLWVKVAWCVLRVGATCASTCLLRLAAYTSWAVLLKHCELYAYSASTGDFVLLSGDCRNITALAQDVWLVNYHPEASRQTDRCLSGLAALILSGPDGKFKPRFLPHILTDSLDCTEVNPTAEYIQFKVYWILIPYKVWFYLK